MIINSLDFGSPHGYVAPATGNLLGSTPIEGYYVLTYNRAGDVDKMTVRFWAKAWQAIGASNNQNTQAALRYLLRQGEELAKNRELGPAYIQWSSSADPAATLNAPDQHDGWWLIDRFQPDYKGLPSGLVQVTIGVQKDSDPPPAQHAIYYPGGTLSTNFAGSATPVIGFPLNSTVLVGTGISRVGGEGSCPVTISPTVNPAPVTLSAAPGDWFKGGCHVYDTVNTGLNPVPTSGAFVNANWVEVFSPDHRYEGDCVITNGLHLWLLQTGQAKVAAMYFWSTGLATPAWQLWGSLLHTDTGGSVGTLRAISEVKVGMEEVRIDLTSATGSGNVALLSVRLQRGRYDVRVDYRSRSENMTSSANGLQISMATGNVKHLVFNESLLGDLTSSSIALTSMSPTTNYGYAAIVPIVSTFPLVAGFLYQNKPAVAQPTQNAYPSSGAAIISLGENSLTKDQTYAYAIFCVPYGVNGSYSPVNLQGEGEGGTLGTGWSSVADANASGGNTAKAASGTASGNADLFGTAFVPYAAAYDVWFRVRVTSAAGSTGEMQLGLWNSTDSTFVASTTYAANQSGTSYGWLRVAHAVTPTAAKNMRFRAVTTGTLGTDWFIDEACLVPLSGGNLLPQDLWQQDIDIRTPRLVRQ